MAKLEKYIKIQLDKGVSKARIKVALSQAGYSKENINKAVGKFFPKRDLKKILSPILKYVLIALLIVLIIYGAIILIPPLLEEDPIGIERKIFCEAILKEDVNYYVGRVEYPGDIPDYYIHLSLYKQDPSLLQDPYLKEVITEEDEAYLEPIKPIITSIINKDINSLEQCSRYSDIIDGVEGCEILFNLNRAIVEANPDYCTFLEPKNLCKALATKDTGFCGKIRQY